MLINKEREYSAQQSHDKWEFVINELGLNYNLEKLSKVAPFSYRCDLFNKENERLGGGLGKGIGIQSVLSEKYEALELYLHALHLYEDVIILSYHEILKLGEVDKEDIFIELLQKLNKKDQPLAWKKLSNLYDNTVLYVPAVRLEPSYINHPFFKDKFNYNDFDILTSDSGTAIGCSYEEAIVHGILEAVERDSLSLFLIRTFIGKEDIVIIEKFSLPRSLQDLVKNIENQYGCEIIICDLLSEVNIPSFMCVLVDRTKKRYYGYGASLDEAYAIERSLLEALQMFHAKKTVQLNKLQEWPELLEIGECNIGHRIAENQFQYKSFGLYPQHHISSLSTMVGGLLTLLREKELNVYVHKIYEHKKSEICLVRCL